MVTKLEVILLVSIVSFALLLSEKESSSTEMGYKKKRVLAEISNPVYTEIDINQSKRIVISKKARQYKERVDFDGFDYRSDKIKLVSKFAREKNGIYTARRDVVAIRSDGAVYKGDKAIVYKKRDLLNFENNFTILDGKNSVVGHSMEYDDNGSSVKAKKVKALYDIATP